MVSGLVSGLAGGWSSTAAFFLLTLFLQWKSKGSIFWIQDVLPEECTAPACARAAASAPPAQPLSQEQLLRQQVLEKEKELLELRQKLSELEQAQAQAVRPGCLCTSKGKAEGPGSASALSSWTLGSCWLAPATALSCQLVLLWAGPAGQKPKWKLMEIPSPSPLAGKVKQIRQEKGEVILHKTGAIHASCSCSSGLLLQLLPLPGPPLAR
ncbi:uncharacterized protein [Melanerpes formicivorus]|uniref:uncharacterized protein n=1 Tax=Melanerpes formicivorus TaxID=211600 RepID=UPI00358E008F